MITQETIGAKNSLPGALRAFATKQFFVFLLVGGAAAAINWGSRFVLTFLFPYEIALIAAYACGMTAAYLANKRLVFPNSSRPVREQLLFFLFVNLIAFPLVWIASWVLSEVIFPHFFCLKHPREIAHAIALALPTFTSFVGHKWFTFRR